MSTVIESIERRLKQQPPNSINRDFRGSFHDPHGPDEKNAKKTG